MKIYRYYPKMEMRGTITELEIIDTIKIDNNIEFISTDKGINLIKADDEYGEFIGNFDFIYGNTKIELVNKIILKYKTDISMYKNKIEVDNDTIRKIENHIKKIKEINDTKISFKDEDLIGLELYYKDFTSNHLKKTFIKKIIKTDDGYDLYVIKNNEILKYNKKEHTFKVINSYCEYFYSKKKALEFKIKRLKDNIKSSNDWIANFQSYVDYYKKEIKRKRRMKK